MSQPQWITPVGSLGTIPENIFTKIEIRAEVPGRPVFYQLIAGQMPPGIQVTLNGVLEGIPRSSLSVQGVPLDVAEDVTSKFSIRAYTTQLINGVTRIDRIADRTFTITVTGQNIPEFLTPPGNVATFFDNTNAEVQIRFTDTDKTDNVEIHVLNGQLPPGMALDKKTGLISGVIEPLVGIPGTVIPGWERTQWEQYPWDFTTRAASKNYQFSLEITDGKSSNVRTFEIFVFSRNTLTADNTNLTADDTFTTADSTPARVPVLLTKPGDLGTVRSDNYFAFKFNAIDFDGDAIEYSITTGSGLGYDSILFDQTNVGFDRGVFSLPPGLSIDPNTGWFYGYIPDQGATEFTYRFAIQIKKLLTPEIVSEFYFFTIKIIGSVGNDVEWLTPTDLGVVDNGAVSMFNVRARNVGGRSLEYRLVSGSNSKLPQGLKLLPSGNIVGRVSFNTFALDSGTTTFDKDFATRLIRDETTFDLTYSFTVNAFSSVSEQIGYQVAGITVTDGGSGYDPLNLPTVIISAPPAVSDAIQATAGEIVIVNGTIVSIAVGNPGRGYTSPPTVTVVSNEGSGATAVANTRINTLAIPVSADRTFTIMVNRAFDTPYESLYIKCMPPIEDRNLLSQLLQNQDIIPASLLYRPDDVNFGVASSVVYRHAMGLVPSGLADYVASLELNHYWKELVLGSIRTAQASDSTGKIIYEVVYCPIIDNLVNNQLQSVNKAVNLDRPVVLEDSSMVTTVYPNSLINMRNQVIATVGQVSPALPLWMLSKQDNGTVLGFVPAWVIAYTNPGQSARLAYNIQTSFGRQLDTVDFTVDRYILDRGQTHNWNNSTDKWIPSPPVVTTFDQTFTIFDGNSMRFISPSDSWNNSDQYDKYLMFPKRTILG